MYSLPVQEARSLKSRKAGLVLSESCENPFHAFLVAFGDCQQALALLGLGMNHSDFQPVFIWSFPSLCMSLFSPLIRIPAIGLRTHPTPL